MNGLTDSISNGDSNSRLPSPARDSQDNQNPSHAQADAAEISPVRYGRTNTEHESSRKRVSLAIVSNYSAVNSALRVEGPKAQRDDT